MFSNEIKYLILIFVAIVLIVLVILRKIVEEVFNKTILEKRKDKDEMIKEMKERYKCNYEDYKDIPYEEIVITNEDGHKIKGYYYILNEDSDKTIIIHHGYKANHYVCLQFADIFFNLGFNALLVDMRSHGESQGEYITYGLKEREDLNLWVDLIRDKIGKDGVIGLHGQSMGGATVLMYGGKYQDKIDFIIADCAYSSGKEIIRGELKKSNIPFFTVYYLVNRKIKKICGFDMNRISPKDEIKSSKTPVLFIHGTADRLVPYEMSVEMYNEKAGEKDKLLLIEGAAHVEAYATNKELYIKTVEDFIRNVKNERIEDIPKDMK